MFALGKEAPWIDETWTIGWVTSSWHDVFANEIRYLSPSAYYPALKLWLMLLGPSVVAGRLLSALFGVISLVPCYVLFRQFANRQAATYALVFVALSTAQIFFSQEIKPYTIAITVSLVGSVFFARILRGDTSARTYLVFVTAFVCCLYVHLLVGLSLVACHAAFVSTHTELRASSKNRIAVVVLIAACAPIVPVVWLNGNPSHMFEIHNLIPQPSLGYLDRLLFELTGNRWMGVLVLGLTSAGIAQILARSRIHSNTSLLPRYATTLLIGPPALVFAVSFLHPFFWLRYFAPSLVLVWLFVSIGIHALPKALRAVALTIVLSGLIYQDVLYYFLPHKQPLTVLANKIEREKTENDVVLIYPGYYRPLSFERLLNVDGLTGTFGLPESADPSFLHRPEVSATRRIFFVKLLDQDEVALRANAPDAGRYLQELKVVGFREAGRTVFRCAQIPTNEPYVCAEWIVMEK